MIQPRYQYQQRFQLQYLAKVHNIERFVHVLALSHDHCKTPAMANFHLDFKFQTMHSNKGLAA